MRPLLFDYCRHYWRPRVFLQKAIGWALRDYAWSPRGYCAAFLPPRGHFRRAGKKSLTLSAALSRRVPSGGELTRHALTAPAVIERATHRGPPGKRQRTPARRPRTVRQAGPTFARPALRGTSSQRRV